MQGNSSTTTRVCSISSTWHNFVGALMSSLPMRYCSSCNLLRYALHALVPSNTPLPSEFAAPAAQREAEPYCVSMLCRIFVGYTLRFVRAAEWRSSCSSSLLTISICLLAQNLPLPRSWKRKIVLLCNIPLACQSSQYMQANSPQRDFTHWFRCSARRSPAPIPPG